MALVFLHLGQLRIITPSSANNADAINEIINEEDRRGFLDATRWQKEPFYIP